MKSNINILIYRSNRLEAEKYAELVRNAGYKSVETASSEEEVVAKLPGTEIIFCWKFPTQLLILPDAKSVRWIQSMGAGVDDLVNDPNIPKDILLTRIVDQFGGPISEYVFAYLLHISQNINRIQDAQSQKQWDPFITDFIAGKTIGIAGLGSIGAELVRKAKAFDMKVYGLSFTGRQAHLVDQHFNSDEWLPFVKELDYLVLTLPLTEQTNQLVSEEVLQTMKKGAWLVNVGRGKLVSESTLISALSSGHLAGAVLDVFETEPLPEQNPLWSLPNVYVTPHLSGPSLTENVAQFFVDNLHNYMSGSALKGRVQREAGY